MSSKTHGVKPQPPVCQLGLYLELGHHGVMEVNEAIREAPSNLTGVLQDEIGTQRCHEPTAQKDHLGA
jgi:hypothetical protein